MALKHLEGCPKEKGAEEKYPRSFVRGGDRYTATVTRCRTCGARSNSKPKKDGE